MGARAMGKPNSTATQLTHHNKETVLLAKNGNTRAAGNQVGKKDGESSLKPTRGLL